MGEVVFSGPGLSELKALGLGSCIGLCAFDPKARLACIAHIVLPQSKPDSNEPGKFADTAVSFVVKEMTARGASKSQLKFAITGGAQLFSISGHNHLDVGKRNTEAVKEQLSKMHLKLVGEDVGGKSGRTVSLDSVTGTVYVRQAGGAPSVLAVLS